MFYKIRSKFSRYLMHKRNVMGGKGEQHWISRLNKQVNYKRTFLSPEKVEVVIPTLPYQAFDLYLSGTRIKPWNLIDLVVSVRLFTQYPVVHTGSPENSIVDTHLLQKENLLFVVAMKIEVNRLFHDPEMPKFPLIADAEVTHVGNSSTRREYILRHAENTVPYITYTIDDVIVNKLSRQPSSFPDWWQNKYIHLKKTKTKFERPAKDNYSLTSSNQVRVEFEHMDHNLHTTTSAYLKFCINTAFKTVVGEGQVGGHLKSDHLRAGVKSVLLIFHSESTYGDTLIVDMFKNNRSTKQNEACFIISKHTGKPDEDRELCTVVIEFYEPFDNAVKGKL